MKLKFKDKYIIFDESLRTENFRITKDIDLIEKSEIQEFIEYNFKELIKSQNIDNQSFKLGTDLFSRFDNLIQLIEPIVNGKPIFHFFDKLHWDLKDYSTAFSVKRKSYSFEFIDLKKAPLLKIDELSSKIDFDVKYDIRKGQSIQGNEWYYFGPIHKYCLPLNFLTKAPSYQKVNFKFNPIDLTFNYSYYTENRTSGSGWFETKFYEGIINAKNWTSEEKFVNSEKEKWD